MPIDILIRLLIDNLPNQILVLFLKLPYIVAGKPFVLLIEESGHPRAFFEAAVVELGEEGFVFGGEQSLEFLGVQLDVVLFVEHCVGEPV